MIQNGLHKGKGIGTRLYNRSVCLPDLGKEMDMNLPEEVFIFVIEVENVIDFDDEPTTAVAAAISGR